MIKKVLSVKEALSRPLYQVLLRRVRYSYKMVLRLLTLLFFFVCTTSFCTGQHFYVYDEEKLIDSLVVSWPAGLVAENDRIKLEHLWKSKIEEIEVWIADMQGCRLSPFSKENLEQTQEKFLEEQRLLKSADDLLHRIPPAFDSIINFTLTERIQQFSLENDIPLVPAHAILYKEESSIDLSYPLVEMLRKTKSDALAIESYRNWLSAEIIRLELDDWLYGLIR